MRPDAHPSLVDLSKAWVISQLTPALVSGVSLENFIKVEDVNPYSVIVITLPCSAGKCVGVSGGRTSKNGWSVGLHLGCMYCAYEKARECTTV